MDLSKLHPNRRPIVGETVKNVDKPEITARITRVRKAPRRSYYILSIVMNDDPRPFDTVSTCWLFS